MGVTELFVLGIGLGMDAFAVSICKGLAMTRMSWKKAGIIGMYFGVFQAIMPLLGFFLGIGFEAKIKAIDHWIALVLLSIIGIKMILEACSKEEEAVNDSVDIKTMTLLGIATSIDALAVGITLAFLNVNIIKAVIAIGVITFLLCVWGVKIGNVFGDRYQKKAEITGGVILILMGVKILIEHLLV